MAEKILNTRVQLKYDTFKNWTDHNPELLSGEVAIAILGNTHTTTSPDNGTHPVVMKVGPGKYNSLPFVSALAADVYAWAKQDEGTFVDNFLSLKTSDNKTMKDVLDGVFATDAELTTAISGVQTSISGIIDRVVALEGKVDVDKVSKAISEAVAEEAARADAAEKKVLEDAKKYTEEEINKIVTGSGYATTDYVDDAVAAHETAVNKTLESYSTTKEMDDAIDADVLVETQRATGAEEALAGRIKALEDVSHDFASADAELKAQLQAEIDADVKALADGAVKANADAIAAINDAEDGILATAKAYTDEVKAGILGEGITETFDTLKEIEDWINAQGGSTVELTKAIAKEAKEREDADTAINNTIATLETKADATEKLNTAKKHTEDSITALALGTMSKETATDYVKKSEAAGYDDILTTAVAASTYRTTAQVDSQIDAKIQALDVSNITGMGAGKTIATLTEADGKIAATFQDIAITKTQITGFSDDDYAKPSDLNNTIVSVERRLETSRIPDVGPDGQINETDVDSVDTPLYITTKNGVETVVDTHALAGGEGIQLSITASGLDNTTTTIRVADKGITTAKIADRAVGAEQTKAYRKADGTSEEVWVFNCGSATELV